MAEQGYIDREVNPKWELPQVKRHPKQKERRRREAAERQFDRDTRSPKQQIKLLDKRLGKGVGAKKERKRLNAQINS